MSRRRIEIPDSLELLLDTICNTFGAVIFISMLLSVLAGGKSQSQDENVTSEMIEQMTMQMERNVANARQVLFACGWVAFSLFEATRDTRIEFAFLVFVIGLFALVLLVGLLWFAFLASMAMLELVKVFIRIEQNTSERAHS